MDRAAPLQQDLLETMCVPFTSPAYYVTAPISKLQHSSLQPTSHLQNASGRSNVSLIDDEMFVETRISRDP